jgi:hypothetical protein
MCGYVETLDSQLNERVCERHTLIESNNSSWEKFEVVWS